MSFKLAAIAGIRPALALVGAAGTAYGYHKWKQTKDALHLHAEREKEMLALFDHIDRAHLGKIDKRELHDALSESGIKTNAVALQAMMRIADEDHDGKISRDEWVHLLQRLDMHVHAVPPPREKERANPVKRSRTRSSGRTPTPDTRRSDLG